MDITGCSFGHLTVIGRSRRDASGLKSRAKYWLCKCACGTHKDVRHDHLMSGRTVSCGCYHKKAASERASNMHKANTTHGMSKTRAHSVWFGMKGRCLNPNNQAFEYYGGRGITVCDRWLESFQNFLDDMGEPPEGYTIERIDVDGNYEPNNCKWADRREQQNNRRANRRVTIGGITKTIMQWSQETGIPHQTLYARLDRGTPDILDTEKQLDLSGLSLGAKISAERRKQRTHCNKGHPFSFLSNGTRLCKVCKNERERERNRKKKRANHAKR